MNTKTIISLIIALALIGGVVWYVTSNNQSTENRLGAQNPEEAVATVNGETITRGELDGYVIEMQSLGGVVLPEGQEERQAFERQALDQLINTRLIVLEIESRAYVISEYDIEAEFTLVKDQFETQEAFESELALANLTEDGLRESIRQQIEADMLYDELLAEGSIEVTLEDAQAVYDEQIAGQEGAPTFEEISAQIIAQLEQQQLQGVIQNLISSLRAMAQIEILI